MKCKTPGRAYPTERSVYLSLLLAIWITLAGCAKTKSVLSSFIHAHGTAKNAPAPHPSRPIGGGPRLAIILDDVAGDDSPASVDGIFALHYPLTLSILPNHPRSTEIAQLAHRRGYQVMLHLPMAAVGNEIPESRELRPGMSTGEISSELNGMLQSVPYAAGVNNHQGSLATSDAPLMNALMLVLRGRNLSSSTAALPRPPSLSTARTAIVSAALSATYRSSTTSERYRPSGINCRWPSKMRAKKETPSPSAMRTRKHSERLPNCCPLAKLPEYGWYRFLTWCTSLIRPEPVLSEPARCSWPGKAMRPPETAASW